MKKLQLKTKISTIALILVLTISAMLVALPAANAQSDLVMNLPGSEGVMDLHIIGGDMDIDLNGGPGANQNVSLFAKYPGDADFSYIGTYVTRSNGDLDVYDFVFTVTGIYAFKWALPPDFTVESNVELVDVVSEILANPYPYINAVPNPVTVNTPTLFHVGSIFPLGSGAWTGLTVEVTTPTGEIVIVGPVDSDLTGGTAIAYTPTMIGTYSVRTHFPEQKLTSTNGRIGPAGTTLVDTYTDPIELIVQQEQIAYYPGRELPDEYWTRPIGGELRAWYTISGHWLAMNLATSTAQPSVNAPMREFNEVAPESAHVLFRRQLQLPGLAGGVTGEHGFEQGDAYEPKLAGAVIVGGILFYNQFPSRGGNDVEQTVVAVDMHTGEVLWNRPLLDSEGTNRRLSFGQVFYWDSYNYHGVFGWLWATQGSTWHAFDPFSGRWVMTFEGVPSGVSIYGPKGEIYRYYVNKGQGIVRLWNSSRVVSNQGSFRFAGDIYDADDVADGIEWSMEVPGLADAVGNAYKYREGVILGANFQRGGLAPNPASMWAVEVTDTGASLMWTTTWTLPQDKLHLTVEDVSVEQDLFICSTKETRVTYGFRLSTGAQIWGPTPMRDYHDTWGHSSGNSWDIIAGDVVIAGNYGGTVWAYHSQNGTVAWTYDIVDPYTESLHGNFWRFRPVIVTDGKLYIENTEHNPRDPQPRGAPFVCLNLTTGEKIWSIPYRAGEWSSTAMIGDSIIVVQNTYDQHLYALGKGPSATTVSIQNDVSTLGSSVMVKGTVMDVSPGTNDPKITLRFPNGVPAVSDASMTDWMTYVYNQFARPVDTVGVQVTLEAYDPNGNYQNLGTTATDANGVFGLAFEPEVPGTYWISATFEGSNGYYGSTTSTYITVDPAPTPATPIEPEEPEAPVTPTEPDEPEEPETPEEPTEPDEPEEPETPEEPTAEAPFITTEVAILAAVAVACVIGVAAFWALKKRK